MLGCNSRDGKIYGIPYTRQVIGYFYNKDLFAQAGIEKPAKTWDEFFEQCDKLVDAGITPLSMDTADSGWVTSLMLGAMIGESDEGEQFMIDDITWNDLQMDEILYVSTIHFLPAAKMYFTRYCASRRWIETCWMKENG